jgi:hypothetical protein
LLLDGWPVSCGLVESGEAWLLANLTAAARRRIIDKASRFAISKPLEIAISNCSSDRLDKLSGCSCDVSIFGDSGGL